MVICTYNANFMQLPMKWLLTTYNQRNINALCMHRINVGLTFARKR